MLASILMSWVIILLGRNKHSSYSLIFLFWFCSQGYSSGKIFRQRFICNVIMVSCFVKFHMFSYLWMQNLFCSLMQKVLWGVFFLRKRIFSNLVILRKIYHHLIAPFISLMNIIHAKWRHNLMMKRTCDDII